MRTHQYVTRGVTAACGGASQMHGAQICGEIRVAEGMTAGLLRGVAWKTSQS